MVRWLLLGAMGAALLAMSPASAQVRMSGSFTAAKACPALQSIRQQANPGEVMLEPGHRYPITGKNRPSASYYQITVEGASPSQRWVSISCGQAEADSVGQTSAGRSGSGQAATHVLALGWEPAFCRQHRDKTECTRETAQSPEATQLSLHGLWPQPRGTAYCNVDRSLEQADRAHRWDALPEPELSAGTRQRLGAVMPGLQSGLERHEWIVHGTCFGAPADAYFNRAASLVEQVNASAVRVLFAQNVGATVSAAAIRAAFDQAFGAGAGSRVVVSCTGQGAGRHIGELVISLAGDVTGAAPIGALMQAAPSVGPGCPSGLVDRALR